MAYDDKDLGTLFPTTNDGGISATDARLDLFNLGGADQIRTKIRTEEIGACKRTIRFRTRQGFPDYVVDTECTDEDAEPVYMDSGAVDLLSVAPSNPDSLRDAPLRYATLQKSYFTQGKLLGKISPPMIQAINPPANGTAGRSFSVDIDEALRGTEQNIETAALYAKKYCVARCPASVFTGKTRLYIQAQYGAPLSNWDWTASESAGVSPSLTHGSGAVVNTNSGVYRDDRYNHWLLTVGPSGVRVTSLVHDDRVVPLVRLLSDATYAADWDKIEAYILAYSRPSSSMTFDVNMTIPETEMMGYGWKFNWDGTAADIIQHVPVSVGGAAWYLDTTRYRLRFHRNNNTYTPPSEGAVAVERGKWKITLSTEEGPTRWHNNYTGECIAYPLWGEGVLAKFGYKLGSSVGDNAPVYCFYVRNELEVIRFYSNGGGRWFPGTNIPKYSRTGSPPAYFGMHEWSVSDLGLGDGFGTIGADGGWGERRLTLDRPFERAFYSSMETTFVTTHSYDYERTTTSGKTFGEYENGAGEYTASVGDIYLNINRPEYTQGPYGPPGLDDVILYAGGSTTPAGDTFLGNGYFGIRPSTQVSWVFEDLTGTHSENGDMVLIVPFYDAEAAYMYCAKSTSRHETGSGGTMDTWEGAWGYWWRIMQTSDGGVTYYEVARGFVERGSGNTIGSNTGAYSVDRTYPTEYETICAKLITSAGTFDFTPPESMGPFHDGNVGTVSLPYHTQSSTMKACFGHGARNLDGIDDVFVDPPPFIGWV